MGFYDNYNFEGTKQIKTKPKSFISEPCNEFVNAVKYLKTNPPLRTASRSLKSA